MIYDGEGFPSPTDFEHFDRLDDQLRELENQLGVETVAVLTMEGKRDWIMVASNGQDAMAGLHREFSEFNPQMETIFDPRWSQYKDLHRMK